MCFVPAASATAPAAVLCADRIGDVHQFTLPSSASSSTAGATEVTSDSLVFGHLAAITDLSYVPHSSSATEHGLVLSCDDEAQVRVSVYPQLYNIQSFCLGHRRSVHSSPLNRHQNTDRTAHACGCRCALDL